MQIKRLHSRRHSKALASGETVYRVEQIKQTFFFFETIEDDALGSKVWKLIERVYQNLFETTLDSSCGIQIVESKFVPRNSKRRLKRL